MASTRNTVQRVAIIRFLEGTHSHPSAEEVFQEMVKEMPSITLATVYRNLNHLSAQGIITRLKVGNSYRFDAHDHGDAHGVCDRCGKVTDLEGRRLGSYLLAHCPSQEFRPTSVKIIFSGVCAACSKRKNKVNA